MKTHQEKIFLVDRYFAGEMTDEEKQKFFYLIKKDKSLREEFLETWELYNNLGTVASLVLRQKIETIFAKEASKTVLRQFYLSSNITKIAAAAAFTALLIISIVIYNISTVPSISKSEIVQNISTTEKPLHQRQLNSRLELLMESNLRNYVYMIMAPAKDTTVKPNSTLSFQWEKNYSGNIKILICDVDDNTIYNNDFSEKYANIAAPQVSGIYYWVAETSEEIIKIDRFYVK